VASFYVSFHMKVEFELALYYSLLCLSLTDKMSFITLWHLISLPGETFSVPSWIFAICSWPWERKLADTADPKISHGKSQCWYLFFFSL